MKLKKVIPVLSIVILASAIRILYYFHYPGIWVQADTYGYYNIGKEILTGKFTQFLINDERTPIYPLLLNLSAYFSGSLGASIFFRRIFCCNGKNYFTPIPIWNYWAFSFI
jgi:hypothetical protein